MGVKVNASRPWSGDCSRNFGVGSVKLRFNSQFRFCDGPSIIVNAAASTAEDSAKSDIESAAAINTVAPSVFAEQAKRLATILAHSSTDDVLDGTKRGHLC